MKTIMSTGPDSLAGLRELSKSLDDQAQVVLARENQITS